MSLVELDEAGQRIAQALFQAFSHASWQELEYRSRWTPKGDVGADDFWVINNGERVKSWSEWTLERSVSRAAHEHWQLTQRLGQPRWYMLTLRLDRAGKYTFEFEYRDNYKEGDIADSLR